MKQFKGMKNLEVIKADAISKGFEIDTTKFDKGDDNIWLRDMDGRFVQVCLNVCNGRFFAYRPIPEDTVWATESSDNLDDDPLYMELLNLFYEA